MKPGVSDEVIDSRPPSFTGNLMEATLWFVCETTCRVLLAIDAIPQTDH